MAKIDSLGHMQSVGDNRHSPLKIVDAKLHPYEARPEESRNIENKIAPKRKIRFNKAEAEHRVKELMGKVKR